MLQIPSPLMLHHGDLSCYCYWQEEKGTNTQRRGSYQTEVFFFWHCTASDIPIPSFLGEKILLILSVQWETIRNGNKCDCEPETLSGGKGKGNEGHLKEHVFSGVQTNMQLIFILIANFTSYLLDWVYSYFNMRLWEFESLPRLACKVVVKSRSHLVCTDLELVQASFCKAK